MGEHVTLSYQGKTYELPVIVGSENERGVDILKLRNEAGLITYDPGFANTGCCKSSITYMDGEQGILRYRGIPVEELAEKSTFKETSYLLINGHLPTEEDLRNFSIMLNDHSLLHEDMKSFYQNFPRASHPMGILSAMVNAMRSFYPELQTTEEEINFTVIALVAGNEEEPPLAQPVQTTQTIQGPYREEKG